MGLQHKLVQLLMAGMLLVVTQVVKADSDSVMSTYTPDLKAETIRMYWLKDDGSPYKTINSLLDTQGKSRQIRMVINGGIYSKSYQPEGLYIEQGKVLNKLNRQKGKGNFFIRPGGVFSVRNGVARIDTLDKFRLTPVADFAVQSGPLLINKGVVNNKFSNSSESRKIRHGVGITDKGKVVFLLSNQAMNFYDFTLYAHDQLKIKDLLYLDGSISKMYTPESPVYYQHYPYVTMITVEAK
ncbi:phosphodiester glycosidase family protein [Budviciaceae bacterium CWB-B4]|uniref:Phosphodiester glycosidase family protein n=1 Tax=Limnobaculum xujianqingii TaxID=2738837 RepID=A0A9D7AJS3_9GAMM|nr:phosphodiester glycosidase family protein [Limnobaculum xujianqingii]MBK5073844.1 phosphodiester glycosidase family protein [Limnobaculum xujianqingii]MBK5177262.1 phosphodiester glycosidase family protein [Limnobaculum xujianqingii]